MNYDIPPDYKSITSYVAPITNERCVNVPFGEKPETPEVNGITIITYSGTVNSSATISQMHPTYHWIPIETPSPSFEMEIQQMDKIYTEVTFPKAKK